MNVLTQDRTFGVLYKQIWQLLNHKAALRQKKIKNLMKSCDNNHHKAYKSILAYFIPVARDDIDELVETGLKFKKKGKPHTSEQLLSNAVIPH
jgi:hypothetical protein